MADYVMQEYNDLNNSGEKPLYPKLEIFRNIDGDEFLNLITKSGSGISPAVAKGVLTLIADNLSRYMAMGYSVTLEGIGTFTPKLGIKKDAEPEKLEEGTHRNAVNVRVTGVNYRADKGLIKETSSKCNLKRKGTRCINATPYSKEDRLQMLVDYIKKNKFIMVDEYASLTQIPSSTATKELAAFALDPEVPISYTGRHSHKVYILEQD